MKHASESTLKKFDRLLKEIDKIDGVKKKKLGVYYVKSKAFLHFHEEEDRLYADVRLNPPEFERLPATTRKDRRVLISAIKQSLGIT